MLEQEMEGENESSMRSLFSTIFTYIESTTSIYASLVSYMTRAEKRRRTFSPEI